MARTVVERLGIVETKVENLSEKLDELKLDVKDMHECLDNTRDLLAEQLKCMSESSNVQYKDLGKKISDMEKLKDKWTYTVLGAVAIVGFLSGHLEKITKLIG